MILDWAAMKRYGGNIFFSASISGTETDNSNGEVSSSPSTRVPLPNETKRPKSFNGYLYLTGTARQFTGTCFDWKYSLEYVLQAPGVSLQASGA